MKLAGLIVKKFVIEFLLFFLNELYIELKAIVALRRIFFFLSCIIAFIWFKMLFVTALPLTDSAFNRKREKCWITLLQSKRIFQSDTLTVKKLFKKKCQKAHRFCLSTALIMKICIDTRISSSKNNQ